MSMVSSPDIPPSVSNLSSSFPFGAAQAGVDLDYIIHNYLPSWEEACRLTGLYLEQAPWFFGAVTKASRLYHVNGECSLMTVHFH